MYAISASAGTTHVRRTGATGPLGQPALLPVRHASSAHEATRELLGANVRAQLRSLGRPPSASAGPEPGPEPAPAPNSEPLVPEGANLTTWQYAKLKDPGFGPWFLALAFLPFLLLLVPLLSSPPMPPVPPSP